MNSVVSCSTAFRFNVSGTKTSATTTTSTETDATTEAVFQRRTAYRPAA